MKDKYKTTYSNKELELMYKDVLSKYKYKKLDNITIRGGLNEFKRI